MRLFLLPISTRRTLIYCEPISQNLSTAQQSYLDRAVAKANSTWAAWEKSDAKWKLKLTEYGNKMFRRIPFEEWGLKTVPSRQKDAAGGIVRKTWEVRYPALYQGLSGKPVLEALKTIATERQPLHRKRMWMCLVGMPFTAPVALLPVIPNIPFFYLVFRCWSNWKALTGSQHLEEMLKENLVRASPSNKLDSLYTAGLLYSTQGATRSAAMPTSDQSKQFFQTFRKRLGPEPSPSPAKTQNPGSTNAQPEEVMLLQSWNGKLIAEQLGLPGMQLEIERAVEQVEASLEKQRQQRQAQDVSSSAVPDKAAAVAQPQSRDSSR